MTEISSQMPEQNTQFQLDFDSAQDPIQKREAIITQLISAVTPVAGLVDMKEKFPEMASKIQPKIDAAMIKNFAEINILLFALKDYPDPARLPEYEPNTATEVIIKDLAYRVRRVLSTMKLFRSLKQVVTQRRSEFAKEYFQARIAVWPLINELMRKSSEHDYVHAAAGVTGDLQHINQELERLRFELRVYLDVVDVRIKRAEDMEKHIQKVMAGINLLENKKKQMTESR